VKQALGDTLEDAFRQTGIIHIVVLSGYNVMLVVAFVMYVFSYFLPLRARVIAGLCAITAFALLVGLSATVVRASIMAGLLLIASALGRTYDVLRGLLLAGAFMLLLNPYLLVYDVGFQLSFLATLGLILVAPQFENLLAQVPTKIGVREFMIATVATQIAVLPLLLYQIGELSLVAVFVNVLVLPMVPVAMLLTFIVGMAAMVSAPLASLFVYPTYLSLTYIIEVALWWASVPFAAVVIPAFPFYVVPIAYFALGAVLWWCANRQPRVAEINNSNLSDWTIVEEVSEVAPKSAFNKSGAPQSGAPDETPVFFR
jgi:competence protein ComEC